MQWCTERNGWAAVLAQARVRQVLIAFNTPAIFYAMAHATCCATCCAAAAASARCSPCFSEPPLLAPSPHSQAAFVTNATSYVVVCLHRGTAAKTVAMPFIRAWLCRARTAKEHAGRTSGGRLRGRTCVEPMPASLPTDKRGHLLEAPARLLIGPRFALPAAVGRPGHLAGCWAASLDGQGRQPAQHRMGHGAQMEVLSVRAQCTGWGLVQRPRQLSQPNWRGAGTLLGLATTGTRINHERNMHCKPDSVGPSSCCAHRRHAGRLSTAMTTYDLPISSPPHSAIHLLPLLSGLSMMTPRALGPSCPLPQASSSTDHSAAGTREYG